MKNKRLFVLASTTSLLLFGVVVGSSNLSSFLKSTFSEEGQLPYNLTLDSTNQPTINGADNSGYLDVAGENMVYTKAASADGAHVKLLDGGSLFKENSKGLDYISATFTGGTLRVLTGYSSNNLEFEYELTSGEATAVKGNSFKLISEGEVTITSLLVTYQCTTSSTEDSVGLKSLKLVYNEDNSNASNSIAKELQGAFKIKYGATLPVVGSDQPNGERAINIGFKNITDENSYTVEMNPLSINLVANDKYGEYEAARYLLNNIDKNDVFNSFDTVTNLIESNEDCFKIMSYNVRCADDGTLGDGSNGDIVNRLPRVAKNILDKLPDSVGVQEATDTWVSGLKTALKPTYNYVGLGRNANRTGEAEGIFYNTNTTKLIESGTKWFSDTPDVPGTRFSGGEYNRLFTYAILQRKTDGKFYMHMNGHYDGGELGVKDAKVLKAFSDFYYEQMPIFATGDFNADKKDVNSSVYWLLQNGYKNSIDDIKDPVDVYTCPPDGYFANHFELWIDYILGANRGMLFDSYEVMSYKVQAGNDPAPAPTSDHSPIFATGHFVEPLIAFDDYYKLPTDSVAINNGYETFDGLMNYESSISQFSNRISIGACNSNSVYYASNGSKYTDSIHNVDYIGGLSADGSYINYSFTSDSDSVADLVLIMAPYNVSSNLNYDMVLSNCLNGSLNGAPLAFDNCVLKCHDAHEFAEWTQLVLRNVTISKGLNNLRLNGKLPNQLCLDIFTNATVSAISEHNYSSDWEASLEGHFHRCSDEGFEFLTTPKIKHTFDSTSGRCSVCGAEPLGEIDLTANAVTLEEYDNKIAYVVNMKPNYDLSEIDLEKIYVQGDSSQGNFDCLDAVENTLQDGYVKFYFDLSGVYPTATSDSVYIAPHLYYNGLPFDGIHGDIRNHYKDSNWDTTWYTDAQYGTSPNHNTVPMYMTEEGHDLTVGKVRARIIYKWSMFMISMSWTEGTVNPTVKSTYGKADFFNMYVYDCDGVGNWNRWSNGNSAPLLYIHFEYTGVIRPETLTLDNQLTLAGFANSSGIVSLVFDCSKLAVSTAQKVHYYYMHLFKNGTAYNYAGSANGDIKTNGSKSTGSTPVSFVKKGGTLLSASTKGNYYEPYESYTMLVIGAKNDS